MYKIYANEKELIFAKPAEKSAITTKKGPINYKSISSKEELLSEINGNHDLIFFSDDPEQALNDFSKDYIQIEAAGGLVRNMAGAYLFIFRRGKWDLPKGKLDPGETIEEAAVREVQEECGIRHLQLGKKLCETFHIYQEKKKQYLKRSYWFEMQTEEAALVPQTEEDITDIRWIAKEDFAQVKANTFASILDVLIFAS
jgi:8-oxo-dGTP pyrophosphatase MutT (NUDIX family)